MTNKHTSSDAAGMGGVSPHDLKPKRAVFNLLWGMVDACEGEDGRTQGTIIGRHASMIDDRINNSGYSRSVDSLKLYTTEQLQDELDSREEEL